MKIIVYSICLIALILSTQGVQAQVLGIDFGSQFFKISLNAPKKQFLIVENTTSNRKTTNAISFYNKERIYDRDASNKQSRNPENTFVFLEKFLGALENDQETFQISKKFYEEYALSFDPERGTAIFQLNRFVLDDPEEIIKLSVEELVGMILSSAKHYAEKMAEIQNIRDCVITVPITWSLRQRLALSQAARIAGLAPLALIHDNTAAALHYGISRLAENATSTVLFYNIGATHVQASLVEYSYVNNTLKSDPQRTIPVINVLSDSGIKNIGGYAYDLTLAKHFANVIDKKPERQGKPSFSSNRRGMVKLLNECNKAKEILSANKELVFFSEGLLEGNDFSSPITRVQFEELSADLLSQAIKPIEVILQKANKTIDQVDVIELVGGGVRIPRIQSILSQYFEKKELGFHLNGDESMALGAAFQAANYSSTFRVKKIWLNDGYNFDIRLVITDLEPVEQLDGEGQVVEPFKKEHTVFPAKTRFTTKKTIALKHDKDISIQVFADSSEEVIQLAQYNITNITSLAQNELYKESGKPKVHLTFELGSIKPIDLTEGYATLNVTSLVEVKEELIVQSTELPKGEEAKENPSQEETKQSGEGENSENPQNFENSSSEQEKETTENQQDATENQEQQQEQQQKQQNEESTQNSSEQQEQNNDSTAEQQNQESSEQQNQESAQEQNEQSQSEESTSQQSEESAQQEQEGEEKATEEPPKKFKSQSEIVEFDVTIQKDYLFFSLLAQSSIDASAQKLKKFDRHEENIKKTASEKNSLESFVYQIREHSEDDSFKKFSLQEERDKAILLADESVAWLEDESFGATYDDFHKKLTTLRNSVRPIIRRIEEHNKRPLALNTTVIKINDYSNKVNKLNKTMDWVTDEQKVTVINLLNEAKEWIQTKVTEQEKLELHEDPAFTVHELESKVNQIKREFDRIKKIKKPKEEKKPESKEEKKTQEEKPNSEEKKAEEEQKQEEAPEQKETKEDKQEEGKSDL